MLVRSLPIKSRKGWHTAAHSILSPHTAAVFMTSPIQAAGHKMATPSHVSTILKPPTLTNRVKNCVKKCCVYI